MSSPLPTVLFTPTSIPRRGHQRRLPVPRCDTSHHQSGFSEATNVIGSYSNVLVFTNMTLSMRPTLVTVDKIADGKKKVFPAAFPLHANWR